MITPPPPRAQAVVTPVHPPQWFTPVVAAPPVVTSGNGRGGAVPGRAHGGGRPRARAGRNSHKAARIHGDSAPSNPRPCLPGRAPSVAGFGRQRHMDRAAVSPHGLLPFSFFFFAFSDCPSLPPFL